MIHPSQVEETLEAAGLVHGLPIPEIHARLRTGLRLADTGQRILAFYLNEMEVGRLYQATGHSSTAFYAEARLGLERRRTRELVAVGKKLLELPAIDAAFCKGEIGWAKVLLVTSVASPEYEQVWLDRARTLSCRDLALEVRLSEPDRPPRNPKNGKETPNVRFKLDVSLKALPHQKLELAKQKLSAECGKPVNDADCIEMMADLVLQMEQDGTVPGMTRVPASLFRIVLRPDEESGHLVMDGEDGPIPVSGGDAIRCDAEQICCGDEDGVGSGKHDHARKHEHDDLAPKNPAWLRALVFGRDAERCRCCGSR
jgi:hypothetical protein